jgi:RsiW-degrading membrane proteinase PrsW (M82 family)
MSEVLRAAISLVPVLAFLAVLSLFDSFRLVRPRTVARALGWGVLVALACFVVARLVLSSGVLAPGTYRRYAAPFLEEIGKSLFVLAAIRRRRVGFMVDAAIVGFATGAGFAAAENFYYLLSRPGAGLLVWLVRGVGTAMMHGGATAIVGIATQALAIRRGREDFAAVLPGLGLATVSHALFNRFILPPVASAVVVVGSFSLLVVLVFERSEHMLREWLDTGFGADVELLEMLRSGEVRDTRIGTYLRSLRDNFPGEVLADMLCYLLVMVELSIKAKVILLTRQAGLALPQDPEIREGLAELRVLEGNIGAAGKLALAPFIHLSSRELWQLAMLEREAVREGAGSRARRPKASGGVPPPQDET